MEKMVTGFFRDIPPLKIRRYFASISAKKAAIVFFRKTTLTPIFFRLNAPNAAIF